MGLIPTANSLKVIFTDFVKVFVSLFALSFMLSKFYILFKEKKLILYVLTFISAVLIIYFLSPLFIISNASYFDWLAIFTAIITIFIIFDFIKRKENNLFLIFCLSVILISIKCLFVTDFSGYGTYYFPLLLLVCLYTFYKYLPEKYGISKDIQESLGFSFTAILIILSCLYLVSNIERRNYAFPALINTNKGIIGTDINQYYAIDSTLKYISENTNENSKILVLPEGAMINFLSGRISNNKFYYLIPPNIDAFGEEHIIENLKNNMPDYILLQTMPYNNFRKTYFCESFGEKICDFVADYYEEPVLLGNNFLIALYKRKLNYENQ